MDMNSFNLFVDFFSLSPSAMADSFAGYNNLGCHLWYFGTQSTWFRALLVFNVSIRLSPRVLRGLTLSLTPFCQASGL